MEIAKDRVAAITYTLKDQEGKVLDTNEGKTPLHYLQGHGNLVPGLEKALEGKNAGDTFQVIVPAAEGYGEYDDSRTFEVPKNELGPNVTPVKGMTLTMNGPNNMNMPVTILKVKLNTVLMDGNHPLAGKDLHFEGAVVEVRKAKKDEIAHHHAHGPGHGHSH